MCALTAARSRKMKREGRHHKPYGTRKDANVSPRSHLRFFKILKPDVIINCVANTNVDNCQKFKNKALITNYKTVKNIVFALKKINLKPHIIHISTDQVYNGSSKKP